MSGKRQAPKKITIIVQVPGKVTEMLTRASSRHD
jgi:hypothetical protein